MRLARPGAARLGRHPGLERRGDARRDRRLGAGAEPRRLGAPARRRRLDRRLARRSPGRSPPATRASGCSSGRRTAAPAAARNDAHPRRPRPLHRLPRRRRPLVSGEARPPDRPSWRRAATRFVYSGYRRVAADGRPLGDRAAAARVVARRAAPGQRHRLPDRGLRHRGLRPGRDAADAPPPGLRPLAPAAAAGALRPRACPRCSPTTGWRPPRSRAASSAAAAATWTLYREVEGLGRPRAGFYLAHNLARALAKRG